MTPSKVDDVPGRQSVPTGPSPPVLAVLWPVLSEQVAGATVRTFLGGTVSQLASAVLRPFCAVAAVPRAALIGMGVLLAASLVGCSTTYREFEAFQKGWRTAEVLEVGLAAEIQRTGLTDCRESATAQELATRRFAVVFYRVSGRLHRHVVTMDEASGIHPGDRVFTNVLRCGTQIELRPPGATG